MIVATTANARAAIVLSDLLHGEKPQMWADSGYQSHADVFGQYAPKA